MEIKTGNFVEKLNELSILCIDSSILIYHLEKIKPYDELTRLLIEEIASGNIFCNISSLTITELFTKPYKLKDFNQISIFEEFINSLPNSKIQPIDYNIAKFAAKLRANYSLRTPDSILLSTAVTTKSEYFFTNDNSFKKIEMEELKILVLDEYLN